MARTGSWSRNTATSQPPPSSSRNTLMMGISMYTPEPCCSQRLWASFTDVFTALAALEQVCRLIVRTRHGVYVNMFMYVWKTSSWTQKYGGVSVACWSVWRYPHICRSEPNNIFIVHSVHAKTAMTTIHFYDDYPFFTFRKWKNGYICIHAWAHAHTYTHTLMKVDIFRSHMRISARTCARTSTSVRSAHRTLQFAPYMNFSHY